MRVYYVLRYFFREALTNLWSNRLNNLVSMAIIIFSLFTFGLFLLTAENLGKMVGSWTENVQVNVFLQKNTPQEDTRQLESLIKLSPVVARYQFVPESEALRRFQSYYPNMKELTSELNANPFPASYEILIRREFQNKTDVQELVQQLRTQEVVQDVEYDQEWIDRIQFIVKFVRVVGLFFGGILMFTATFSISNVIKLMVLSRRDEIEIMRLVGATNSFIKGPFLTEGVLQGFIGGLSSVILLFGLYQLILSRIVALQAPFFSSDQIHFLSPWMIVGLIGGGMLVGFFGSLFSLERLVKI